MNGGYTEDEILIFERHSVADLEEIKTQLEYDMDEETQVALVAAIIKDARHICDENNCRSKTG